MRLVPFICPNIRFHRLAVGIADAFRERRMLEGLDIPLSAWHKETTKRKRNHPVRVASCLSRILACSTYPCLDFTLHIPKTHISDSHVSLASGSASSTSCPIIATASFLPIACIIYVVHYFMCGAIPFNIVRKRLWPPACLP